MSARGSAPAETPSPGREPRFSRFEIQATCTKAARGAGWHWGMAEEAGMAARRLVEAALPGPELLLARLEAACGGLPRPPGSPWTSPGGQRLCPLAAGVALADRARLLHPTPTDPLRIVNLAFPALLLPFSQAFAGRHGGAASVRWCGFEAIVTADAIVCDARHPALGMAEAALVTVCFAHCTPRSPRRVTGRAVALELWERLERLALETTVPATATSRAGAGAGISDND